MANESSCRRLPCAGLQPAPAAVAAGHRRGGRRRRRRRAVVARPELEPAVRQSRATPMPARSCRHCRPPASSTSSSDDSGAVMVPAERVHDARLKLAAQGLPQGKQQRARPDQQGLRASASASSWRTRATSTRSKASWRAPSPARCRRSKRRASIWRSRSSRRSCAIAVRPAPRCCCSCGPADAWNPEQVSAIVHLVASSIPELDRRPGHGGRSAGPPAVVAEVSAESAMQPNSSTPRIASKTPTFSASSNCSRRWSATAGCARR